MFPGEHVVEALPADPPHRFPLLRSAEQLEDAVAHGMRITVPVGRDIHAGALGGLLRLFEVERHHRLPHRHVFDDLVHGTEVVDGTLWIR